MWTTDEDVKMTIVDNNSRALHRYRKKLRFKISYRPETFSGPIFTTALVVFITATIPFIFM